MIELHHSRTVNIVTRTSSKLNKKRRTEAKTEVQNFAACTALTPNFKRTTEQKGTTMRASKGNETPHPIPHSSNPELQKDHGTEGDYDESKQGNETPHSITANPPK
jgi:hypothetical protein